MIHYVEGDATQPQGTGEKFIVHCCNNRGKWGRGFVVALSRRWANPEHQYRNWDSKLMILGHVQFVRVEQDITVCNLIGQQGTVNEWNTHPVKYDAIYDGMCTIAHTAKKAGASLHMPRMGCGLAGGYWPVIAGIVEETCRDIPVFVYDLPGQPFRARD